MRRLRGGRGRRRLSRAQPARALLLAPARSYRTAAYRRAARALGVELVVGSEGECSLTPAAERGLALDPRDREASLAAIAAEAQRAPIGAVLASDDATVELAALAARRLGLPHNAPHAARLTRRKDLARARLAEAGVAVPAFRRLDLAGDLERQAAALEYPCVIKPLALSGSRGVMRVDGAAALPGAARRLARIVAAEPDPEERRFALAEAFVPGVEVALEGLLAGGELRVLALFDKPDPLDGPFFEETYYVTPSRLPAAEQRRVWACVAAACAAYGLREGPVHAELRLDRGRPWLLEVAARTIGGDCARLLRFASGCGLEEVVLAQALGRAPRLDPLEGAAGVLMIPTERAGTLRRVEGVLAARAVPGVEDVVITLRAGYELVPLPEGASYLGFVFARAATPEAVEAALRAARARLRVVVAPAWRIEPAA